MKFKRINVDTVRCLISEQELWENGLEIDDFLQNDGKAEDFLRKIISEAAKEVGYKVRGGNISIQVSVLPDHVLALTFSEKQDEGIINMLQHLKKAVETLSQSAKQEAYKEGETPDSGRHAQAGETEEEDGEGALAQEIPTGSRMTYQLCFDSLENAEKYCSSVLVEVPVENSFYKLEEEKAYFILIRKGTLTDKQLCRLLGASLEFATGIYSNDAADAYIREHGTALIRENAIQRMQQL